MVFFVLVWPMIIGGPVVLVICTTGCMFSAFCECFYCNSWKIPLLDLSRERFHQFVVVYSLAAMCAKITDSEQRWTVCTAPYRIYQPIVPVTVHIGR